MSHKRRPVTSSRRTFLAQTGGVAAWFGLKFSTLCSLSTAAAARAAASDEFVVLSPPQVAGFGALADQVIPPDESPGAVQSGVIYFLDEALKGPMAAELDSLARGLEHLDQHVMRKYPAVEGFAALSSEDQTRFLEQHENHPVFQAMIEITQMGMFGLASYGGNRDLEGWKLIGFEHQHAWQPPFGHYDRKPDGSHVED